MARTLTPENLKLKQDAIRIRQELGWSIDKIAVHLNKPHTTIERWINHNSNHASYHYPPIVLNKIYIMDSIEGMGRLPHNYVDLVFTDPPYNLGVDYGNDSFSDKNDAYYDWCHEWFRSIERILKPGGSFYLIQYPEYCAYFLPRLRATGFKLQRWIVWHYPIMMGQSPQNWTRSHRTILFLTKGIKPAYFNGLADPQPYRNPTDKRIQERLKTSPGAIPYDVWNFNIVKNVSQEKTSWPNQIPVKLIERIIKVSCPENGIVCDPFIGSGSTAVASIINKRKWIGFDISPESKIVTENRIGELQLRL